MDAVERVAIDGWKAVMANPFLYRASGRLASLATRLLGGRGQIGWLPPPLSEWTSSRDFPTFGAKSFAELWEEQQE